jgi:metal-responsive CopG/Arc/MetJ family transcriptional regulator
MKSHISATIDDRLVQELNRYGLRERRSRSQIIEMALEDFLRAKSDTEDGIVVSEGRFEGGFSREDTYAR